MHPLLLLLLAAAPAAADYLASFLHGVASGDPHSDSIVLWTRLSPHTAEPAVRLNVTWRVWRDGADGTAERQGWLQTDGETDWTVKLIVDGLTHSTDYAYAFAIGAARSASGRFKLPPPAGVSLDRLTYAVFSCSSWSWGYFNAFRAAATQAERLDFWLHVGDYYYEYGQEGHYPAAHEAVRWHGLQPPTETLSLADYRLRHALQRTDADLQLLSSRAPLIAIWDDHEVANDPWVGGAQNHNEGEGDWWARKRDAVRAYHEWMPTRTPPPRRCAAASSDAADAPEAVVGTCAGTHEGEEVYRAFRFGDLAALYMLETRLLARSEQARQGARAEVAAIVGGVPPRRWAADAAVVAALAALNASWHEARGGEGREMLGATQLAWLRGAMEAGRGAAWQLVGQQVIVQPRNPPDLELAARNADAPRAQEWHRLLETLTATTTTTAATAGGGGDGDGGGGGTTTVEWHDGAAAAAPLLGSQQPVDDAMVAATRAMVAMAQFGLNADFDGWDGYPAARRRFVRILSEASARAAGRVAVYAGDSHAAWAGRLTGDDGEHVALEFDGTAVTSSGPDSWTPYLPPELLAAAWREATPTLDYANTHKRGWMAVTLTPTEHTVAFMTVSTVGSRARFESRCDAAFAQSAAEPHVMRAVRCADALPAADVSRIVGEGAAAIELSDGAGDGGGEPEAAVALAAFLGLAVGVVCTVLVRFAVKRGGGKGPLQMARMA